MRRTAVLVLLCLFALVAVSAWAQTGTSRITGTVVDKTGAVVSGAKVIATNQGTNVAYTTKTSSTGAYSFESLQPGVYKVEVQAEGFKTYIAVGNTLAIGQPTTINVSLEVGATAQTVQVEAAAEMVQTSSSGNFGNVVDNTAVTELPIITSRGRNPIDLVNFQPGVVVGSNTGGGVYVHGARDRAWDYTLDGIDVNETSTGGGNYTPLKVNPDMLTEFRVVTGNASADIGRASGGQVQMVTKSGTNNLHGSGFFFYQTPSLNANEVGNKIVYPALDRPQFVQRIGGFSIGGPIIKNKTFFFGNFQLLRTLQTTKYTSTVYTNSARKGLFRYVIGGQNLPAGDPNASVDNAGNIRPGVNVGTYDIAANDPDGYGLDSSIQNFIGLTPLPNNYTVGDGLNTAGYSWNSPENHKEENYVVKVDHNFSQANQIFVRYAWGRQDTLGDIANGGQRPFPDSPNVVDTYRRPKNLAINWRFTPSANMTNEFVLGMNRFSFDFANPDNNYASNPPYILNDVTIPLQNYAGNKRTLTTYQMNDNFSITKGPHTMRMGMSLRYQRHIDNRGSVGIYDAMPLVYFNTDVNSVDAGLFNIPGDIDGEYDQPLLENTINNLLGRVGTMNVGLVGNVKSNTWNPAGTWFNFDTRFPEYDFYFQDNWKVKPNLTIDAGLRWEIKLSPRSPQELFHPDNPMTVGSPASNTVKWVPGNLWNDQWKNIGPSIGFAWDPFKDGKTSIRGNYRLAFDRINTFVVSGYIVQALPGYTYSVSNDTFGGNGGRIRDGLPSLVPPAGVTPETELQPAPFQPYNWNTVMDPNLKTPSTHMWGFSIQRELPKKMVLELNYLGRHGQNLFGGYDGDAHDIWKNGFLGAFNELKATGTSALIDQLLAGYSSTKTGSEYVLSNSTTKNYIRRNSVAQLAQWINQRRADDGSQLIQANGFSPFFFSPFPQFMSDIDVLDSHDYSNYHALEAQVQRRMSNGLQFQISYTFAKSLDTRSYDPTFSTVPVGGYQSSSSVPWDNTDRSKNYAASDFDRRHALQGNFIYELPFGRGKSIGRNASSALDKLIGGFQVAGIITLQSGRPFTVYSGAYTFNNSVATPASCDGCASDMGRLHWEGGDGPYTDGASLWYFTPEQTANMYQPAPGSLSNLGRNYFRLPHNWNLDMAIAKKIKITSDGNHELELRLDMQNVTNSVVYDTPYSMSIISTMFGYMSGQTFNNSRKMQLVAKYTF